eukprot:jgi/Orpsp1_1/1183061/evm.model.c7180000083690.1
MNNTTTITETITKAIVTTTTTIVSTATNTPSSTTPSKIPQNPPPVEGSKIYPIVCVVCGLAFVAAVFFYVYATRNKSYNTDNETLAKRTINQNYSGNSGRLDIRVDRPSKNSSTKSSNFNMSADSSFPFATFAQSENRSPYSEQSPVNSPNPMGFDNGINQRKPHYPNPLFEHSRPVNRTPTVIRATESDITDEDVNLNIFTQEEIQLLKMKKKNMKNGMVPNNAINMNNQMFNSNSIEPNPMVMNYGNYPNRNMNNMNQASMVNPKIKSKIPDKDVAPFNYMNSDPSNPREIFKRESDESSFYDSTFIRNLGSDVKI